MFNRIVFSLLISVSLLTTSCSDSSSDPLPEATGRLGTVVVVADNSSHKALKDSINLLFMSALPYLPSGEPYFEMYKPNPEDFKKFYFNQKSVFVLVKEEDIEYMDELLEKFGTQEIQDLCNNPQPVLKVLKNVFATNQHIVYLFGKDNKDLGAKMIEAKDLIRQTLIDYELKDEQPRIYKGAQKNDVYRDQMKKELGMSVRVPDMFVMKYHKDGFWWFEYNAKEDDALKTVGILVHAYPYKDTADFSYAGIRSARDSVAKYHVKGDVLGSYMGTSESKFYPPRFIEKMEFNSHFTTKVRGWWNMWNMSMGGPFIRYVVHNEKNDTLFAFEGFVFKPELQTKERDLRLIESIALTIE